MNVEIQILNLIQLVRNPILDMVMPAITRLGSGGAFWIALALLLLMFNRQRKKGIVILCAILFSFIICNIVLKNVFCRIRPFEVNTAIQLIVDAPKDYSFPSGHTSVSFAAVSALYFAKDRHLWKCTLVLAFLIAFSRMYLYVHYPTDILGGMIIGILCGYLGVKVVDKIAYKEEAKVL